MHRDRILKADTSSKDHLPLNFNLFLFLSSEDGVAPPTELPGVPV